MQPSNKAIYLLFFPVAEKCFILQVYNGRWPLAELFSADQNVARPNRTSWSKDHQLQPGFSYDWAGSPWKPVINVRHTADNATVMLLSEPLRQDECGPKMQRGKVSEPRFPRCIFWPITFYFFWIPLRCHADAFSNGDMQCISYCMYFTWCVLNNL